MTIPIYREWRPSVVNVTSKGVVIDGATSETSDDEGS
jgi:hypothetical protein